MPKPDQETLELYVDEISTKGVNLTVWEEDFIEDMQERIASGLDFTGGQAESIEKIYAERTP